MNAVIKLIFSLLVLFPDKQRNFTRNRLTTQARYFPSYASFDFFNFGGTMRDFYPLSNSLYCLKLHQHSSQKNTVGDSVKKEQAIHALIITVFHLTVIFSSIINFAKKPGGEELQT